MIYNYSAVGIEAFYDTDNNTLPLIPDRRQRIRSGAWLRNPVPVLFTWLIIIFASAPAYAWNGKVLKILSGDTFTVTGKSGIETVKLYGIDCPSAQSTLGKKAAAFTGAKINGRTVKINPLNKDRFNRIVALVSINGQSLNTFLVRSGYALVNKSQCTASYCQDWLRYERIAHKKSKGIWADLQTFAE